MSNADSGTTLGDYGAGGQATLGGLEEDQDDDTCPTGAEWCDGPEMLEDGDLCCAGCWIHHATRDQLDAWENHPDSVAGARKEVGD